MTPDNFFKINPDIQPGTKKTLEGEAKEFLPKKPEGQPEGNTDFSKILDNPDNERAKTSAGTKEALQPGSTLTAKQANAEDSLLSTTEPRVAERTGQPPSITKESKVAAPLESQKPTAPPEEPRTPGHIEPLRPEEQPQAKKNILEEGTQNLTDNRQAQPESKPAQEDLGSRNLPKPEEKYPETGRAPEDLGRVIPAKTKEEVEVKEKPLPLQTPRSHTPVIARVMTTLVRRPNVYSDRAITEQTEVLGAKPILPPRDVYEATLAASSSRIIRHGEDVGLYPEELLISDEDLEAVFNPAKGKQVLEEKPQEKQPKNITGEELLETAELPEEKKGELSEMTLAQAMLLKKKKVKGPKVAKHIVEQPENRLLDKAEKQTVNEPENPAVEQKASDEKKPNIEEHPQAIVEKQPRERANVETPVLPKEQHLKEKVPAAPVVPEQPHQKESEDVVPPQPKQTEDAVLPEPKQKEAVDVVPSQPEQKPAEQPQPQGVFVPPEETAANKELPAAPVVERPFVPKEEKDPVSKKDDGEVAYVDADEPLKRPIRRPEELNIRELAERDSVKGQSLPPPPKPEYLDVLAINLFAIAAIAAPATGEAEGDVQAVNVPQDIRDIVRQIVSHLETIERKDQIDTVIVLSYPPKFDGAKIIVTSYKSARGEINITFENLKPEAKQVLDNVENRSALKQALDQKGYTVHIITTTTQTEVRYPGETSGSSRDDRGSSEGRSGGRGEKDKEDEREQR